MGRALVGLQLQGALPLAKAGPGGVTQLASVLEADGRLQQMRAALKQVGALPTHCTSVHMCMYMYSRSDLFACM